MLAWSDLIRRAEHGRRHGTAIAELAHQRFRRDLRRGIDIRRSERRAFVDELRVRSAIHVGTRRHDQTDLWIPLECGEERRCAEDIDPNGGDRIARSERGDGLRRQMHDRIGPRGNDRRAHGAGVDDVPLVHVHASRDGRKMRVRRILVREAMHDDALSDEALGEMAASESRDAGDEDGARHLGRVLVRGGGRLTRTRSAAPPGDHARARPEARSRSGRPRTRARHRDAGTTPANSGPRAPTALRRSRRRR